MHTDSKFYNLHLFLWSLVIKETVCSFLSEPLFDMPSYVEVHMIWTISLAKATCSEKFIGSEH